MTSGAARGDDIKTGQRAWIKRYGTDCGLSYRGRPSADQIQSATGCIGAAIEQRIAEIKNER